MKTMHICQPSNIQDYMNDKDLVLYRTGWIKELYKDDHVFVYVKGNKEYKKEYQVEWVDVQTYTMCAVDNAFLDEIKAYNRTFDPRHLFIIYKLKRI